MEFPNYYYDDPNGTNGYRQQPKKRGIGGYIITAVVFFLIGAMASALFMKSYAFPASDGSIPNSEAFDRPNPPAPAIPVPTPGIASDDEQQQPLQPAMTPQPAVGTMPSIDGVAPNITDFTNPILDIVDQVSEGVVGVVNYTYNPKYSRQMESGSGSGFIISTEGYILTNAHVVDGATKLGVMFVDGEECEAKLIGFDNTSDVAVLKVEKAGLKPLKLGIDENVRVGEFVIAIGDPTGRELAGTTTFGIISATARNVNIDGITNEYLQTDAAVNPGNSGGPLINMNGNAIGIISAKTVTASFDELGNAISAEGLGFALPIDKAMAVATELITNGRVLRPGVGISVSSWEDIYAEEYGTPEGILVATVTKDGPGHKAGLQVNDIIVEIDGQSGLTQDEFVAYVKGKNVGDIVTMKYWRAGQYYEAKLELCDLNSLGDEIVGGQADYNFFGE